MRKLDLWLLPFLSMMYFFNSIDRVSHENVPECKEYSNTDRRPSCRVTWEMPKQTEWVTTYIS